MGLPKNGLAAYQHELLSLAEGFRALGVPVYANTNYWRLGPDTDRYLIEHDPSVGPEDCTIVVMEQAWFYYRHPFPDELFYPGRPYDTVYLDCADGVMTHAWEPPFRQFDHVFATHYTTRRHYPANFTAPWAFGLSNRILEATTRPLPFEARRREMVAGFRVGHFLRDEVRRELLQHFQRVLYVNEEVDAYDRAPQDPQARLWWAQTGARHYPQYYERLKSVQAVAAFGGDFLLPWPFERTHRVARVSQRYFRRFVYPALRAAGKRPKSVFQWDSWRFWESLAAGCATFQLDFEKYGFRLPVMPENGRHYIGIDLDNVQETVDRIADDPSLLERVAAEGRRWARRHYAPEATARRFLQNVRAARPVRNTA